MIGLTTPTAAAQPATDAKTRARTAVGRALGILHPGAMPLRDGRVWLTSRSDMLAAGVLRRLEVYLARRAP